MDEPNGGLDSRRRPGVAKLLIGIMKVPASLSGVTSKHMIRFLQSGSRGVKWIISGFLLIICGAMVITLIPGGFLTGDSANTEGVLAKVAGEEVTTSQATAFAQ